MEWACEDLNLGPLPYQLTARNRCAGARFRRSRPTVGAEVKCSIGVQLCVLPMRLEIHWRRADHRPFPQGYCVVGLLLVTASMRSCGRWLARLVARAMLVSPLLRW